MENVTNISVLFFFIISLRQRKKNMPTMTNNIKNVEDFINFKSDIEPDSMSENDIIQPYNPEKISIETKRFAMETCLRRLRQGTFVLNPEFQRNEVWSPTKKSLLIESLMLKIPIPMFYVASDPQGVLTVVDGLQRLSTIRDFIVEKTLVLQNLEFWRNYNNFNFDALPDYIQNRILETEFTFTIINPGTPEEVKLNIFKRINTGGMPLSTQEIRNALYVGKSTRLLQFLSQTDEFKTATGNSIHSLRMEDKELILRYLAFKIFDYKDYDKKDIDGFLSQTMLKLNASTESDLNTIKTNFKISMKRCFNLFGKHTFRKSFGNSFRSPINKCLFEVWGCAMSNVNDRQFEMLLKHKESILKEYNNILTSDSFIDSISRNSMSPKSVNYRFETINNIIKRYTNV